MHLIAGMRVRALVAALLVGAVLLGGCGSKNDYKNDPRPPVPINVTAELSDRGVGVSPTHFGAGPIVLIITNQSTRSQAVTLTDGDKFRQSIPAINPGDTGQIKADVVEGSYQVKVGGQSTPASLTVGAKRPSAQNEVLQP